MITIIYLPPSESGDPIEPLVVCQTDDAEYFETIYLSCGEPESQDHDLPLEDRLAHGDPVYLVIAEFPGGPRIVKLTEDEDEVHDLAIEYSEQHQVETYVESCYFEVASHDAQEDE